MRSLRNLRDQEKNHEDPDTKPSVLTGNCFKTQDEIREWLRCYHGTKKAPLTYVVCDETNPPDKGDNPSTNYATVEDKMIDRAPIESTPGVFNPTYKVDNKTLWDKLANF